jgi:hypothetical protein
MVILNLKSTVQILDPDHWMHKADKGFLGIRFKARVYSRFKVNR